MADSGVAKRKERQPKKKNKNTKRKDTNSTQSERPPKTHRIDSSEKDTEPQVEAAEIPEQLKQGGPWTNLELILSLHNKDLPLHKKVESAYGFVTSRVKEEEDNSSNQDNQAVNLSRLVVFVSDWIQSLLISEGKKIQCGEAEFIEAYLDLRCWEIFRFCLEESLRLNVSLTLSRNLLRSIGLIARSATALVNETCLRAGDFFAVGERLQLYNTMLDCITLVFSSREGLSNENLDLWASTVGAVLDLTHKFYTEDLVGGNGGVFVFRFSCLVLEPFARFLRAHPGRKNGFRDFIDKLLEPLLHLLGLLQLQINGSNHYLTTKLLKLVEEAISHGLYHPVYIDGFLNLSSTEKYAASNYKKSNDSKTTIKSYHRHLFDKLEGILAVKNALALENVGVLFHLLIDQVKKLKRTSMLTANTKMSGKSEGSRQLEDNSFGQTSKMSSGSSIVENNYSSTSFNPETRKSLHDFFVLIMEPLLLEIDDFCETKLEVGTALLDVHSTLKSINNVLSIFVHEKVYVRTEDASKGASLNFLKKVYGTIISLSSKLIQLSDPHACSIASIANEVLSAVGYLLEIEYEVIENDLVSLWLIMLSYLTIGPSSLEISNGCSLSSKITDIGCQLVILYSQLRQVNNTIFSLCKAIRLLNLHNSDEEVNYTRFVIPLHGEAYAKSVETLLCAQELKSAIHQAMKSIPEGQASGCIQQLTLDVSESLEWMKISSLKADEKELDECHVNSLRNFDLEAEVLGRGLSELYGLVLESLIVTSGNCSLLGASIKELIRVIFPCMSSLVGSQQDAVKKFLLSVTGKASDNEIPGNKIKCPIVGLSTYWVVVFFFRLYVSCRCLYRQAVILMPTELSRKMSMEMGDSLSSFSGRDWMEMSDWVSGGYFSWIIQPSASLLAVIQSVSSIYCKDRTADSCPLTYMMHVMACERLVHLNSHIKSFEYLTKNGDNLVQETHISDLRQEATALTGFVMEHLSLVSEEQHLTFSSDDTTNNKMFADEWDFSICSLNKKSLPTAIWWLICQNIHVWCPNATKKDLKTYLSLLIRTSFPCVRSSFGMVREHKNCEANRLKKVTMHQISSQCFVDSVLYEQRFVSRYFAKRFCRALQKSTVPFVSDSPTGNAKFKSSPNWAKVLNDFEKTSAVVSCSKLNIFDCSSASTSKERNTLPSTITKFTACQSLLNLLSCMPKGHFSSKSFSRYVTTVLNLERTVVGSLLDNQNALYSTDCYELFRLFVSCRKALKYMIMACEEETVSSETSENVVLFQDSFHLLWLYKSVYMVAGLRELFSKDFYSSINDMMLALMDHTFYVFLTLNKYQSNHAIHLIEVAELNTKVAHGQSNLLDFSNYTEAWRSVNVVSKILEEQMQSLLVNLKDGIINGEGFGVEVLDLNKFSSIVSCFSGFLWGMACVVMQTDGRSRDGKAISRRKPAPIPELNLCINVFAEMSSLLLEMFSFDNIKLSRAISDDKDLQKSDYNADMLGADDIFPVGNDSDTDMSGGGLQDESAIAVTFSALSDGPDNSAAGRIHRRKSCLKDANCIVSVLTAIDSFEMQSLDKPLLRSMLKGDFPDAAFLLRQLLIASSAVLRLNLHINSAPLSSSLVHKLAGIMQFLLLESVDTSQVPHFCYFVCLDGALKFLEELGNHFPLTNPTLSRNLFDKMVQLQLWALGKCITLQGKRATLASHETSTKMLHSTGISESSLSGWSYLLDEFKARLRSSFTMFIKKSTEMHLKSTVEIIERALAGVREGCPMRYDIQTGSANGGKVSSVVASGIDCLDLVLEFVSGRNLSVVKRHIQGLIACVFNIILHLQSPLIFYESFIQSKSDPDPGTVVLMCVDVLARISGKHAMYKMDPWHVAHSLRIPSALFQDFHLLPFSKAPGPNDSSMIPNNQVSEPVASMHVPIIDRQYSVDLFSACCRLLHNVVKHHKSECEGSVALLQASVRVLLCCLETLDAVTVAKEVYFSWEIEEGVKCACSLRRIYEELRHQKDVFGLHCSHFLAYYIQVYAGHGPRKTGIKREIDEALRPGVYALVDVCSADDLQRLHTSFGEGPCRNTLASLKHDYELNFQYQGKV